MNFKRIDQNNLQRIHVKLKNNSVNLILQKNIYHVTSCVIDNNTYLYIIIVARLLGVNVDSLISVPNNRCENTLFQKLNLPSGYLSQ